MPTARITKPYTAKSRPIIFKAEMVRAILDGRKTQTRRVINPRSKNDFIYEPENKYSYSIRGRRALWHSFKTQERLIEKFCPYGVPSDFLWVRETWATGKGNNFAKPSELPRGSIIFYKDGEWKFEVPKIAAFQTWIHPERGKWRPSIFMPRWASRISLRIIEIGVERIQELSREDFLAEGIPQHTRARGVLSDNPPDPHWKFIELWDSINAKRGYSWESNPWVWVIEFERIEYE